MLASTVQTKQIKDIIFGNLSYKKITTIIKNNPEALIVKVDCEKNPRIYYGNKKIAKFLEDLHKFSHKSFVFYPSLGVEQRYNFAEILCDHKGNEISSYYTTPNIIDFEKANDFSQLAGKLAIFTVCQNPIKATLLCVNQEKKKISFLYHSDAQNDEQGERDLAALQCVEAGIIQDAGLMKDSFPNQAMKELGLDKIF